MNEVKSDGTHNNDSLDKIKMNKMNNLKGEKARKRKDLEKEKITQRKNICIKWKKVLSRTNQYDTKYNIPAIEKSGESMKIITNSKITELKIFCKIKTLEIICNYDSMFYIQDCKDLEKIKITKCPKYNGEIFQTIYIYNCPNLIELEGANFVVETELKNLRYLENKGNYPCQITLNSISKFCKIKVLSIYGTVLSLYNYKPDKRINHLELTFYSSIHNNFLDELEGLETLDICATHLFPIGNNFIIKNQNLKVLSIVEFYELPYAISCPLLQTLVISSFGGFDVKLSDLPIIEFSNSIKSLEFYIPIYSESSYDISLSYWPLKFTHLEKLDIIQKNPFLIEDFSNSKSTLTELRLASNNISFDTILSYYPLLQDDKCFFKQLYSV